MKNTLWEQWHNSYSESVRNFCVSRLTEGDMQTADELTAIAIEKGVIAASKNPKDITNISGYLIRIATNTYLDQRRARLAHEDISMNKGDIFDLELASKEMSIEEQVLQSMLKERINGAIDDLQPTFRRLAKARFIEEMSYEDIATKFHISIGTVKSGISRAKELLKAVL